MVKLVALLEAIRIYSKDCHYNFRGVDYKPLHEWMDEIFDPMSDWIDEIKESMILSKGQKVPRGTEINDEAKQYVPTQIPNTNEEILRSMRALLAMTHNYINDELSETSVGSGDLLGRIDVFLQNQLGLFFLALGE